MRIYLQNRISRTIAIKKKKKLSSRLHKETTDADERCNNNLDNKFS